MIANAFVLDKTDATTQFCHKFCSLITCLKINHWSSTMNVISLRFLQGWTNHVLVVLGMVIGSWLVWMRQLECNGRRFHPYQFWAVLLITCLTVPNSKGGYSILFIATKLPSPQILLVLLLDFPFSLNPFTFENPWRLYLTLLPILNYFVITLTHTPSTFILALTYSFLKI